MPKSHVEELEKSLAEMDLEDEVEEEEKPVEKAVSKAKAKAKAKPEPEAEDDEPLEKGGDGDGDADDTMACSECGHDGMRKGITTCPKCGASMKKSMNEPAKQQVDVTEWLGGIEEKIEKSLGAGDIFARSQLALIKLVKSQAAKIDALESGAEEIRNARSELADMQPLLKSLGDRLGVVLQAPRPRKSIPTDGQILSKGGANGNGEGEGKENGELTVKQKAQWHGLLHKGLVSPNIALAVDRRQLSIPDAIEVVQSQQVDVPHAAENPGGFSDRW
jgi:uncharacterized Zn finger protein (UPF0148 family)